MTTDLAERVAKLLDAARHRIIRTQRLGSSLGPARWCFIVAAPWIAKGRTRSISSPRHLHGMGVPFWEIQALEKAWR